MPECCFKIMKICHSKDSNSLALFYNLIQHSLLLNLIRNSQITRICYVSHVVIHSYILFILFLNMFAITGSTHLSRLSVCLSIWKHKTSREQSDIDSERGWGWSANKSGHLRFHSYQTIWTAPLPVDLLAFLLTAPTKLPKYLPKRKIHPRKVV